MKNKARIIINIPGEGIREELEVPLDITANDLILALNQIYSLDMDTDNCFQYYLKADNPKALLRGNKILQDYGIRCGTEIYTWKR